MSNICDSSVQRVRLVVSNAADIFTACVSHHAAFEYYGCANQVSYRVDVSSDTPFAPFST